ncbi:hypothetical protein GCM10010517_36290 [Streptosporangium fragile]|uniref:Uncharacterized protein n=1 Tax=Streptosporangium fragile TaxID=46186 RepID=A0ABN3VZ83_9ACTN
MDDRDEEALVRVLARAAESAPDPAEDLVSAVLRKRRRRTRVRAQTMLAVAGTIALVGGVVVAKDTFSSGGGDGATVSSATPPSEDGATPVSDGERAAAEKTARAQVRPVAEVWPEAVSTIPAKSADGRRYRPITGLSATELLLSAESSFEKAGRLEVYDTVSRRSTVLANMPATGVKGYFAQDFEVGADHIAWWGSTPGDPDEWADFWVVPRSGGTPRRVGEVTGDLSKVTRIAVTTDSLLWSVHGGGVYRLPLGGGNPERLRGTDGLHLLTWPLAADVGEREGEGGKENQSKVVNLETGQTTGVNVPGGVEALHCGPTWCFGEMKNTALVQRLDGSGRRLLPGFSTGFGVGDGVFDRFGKLTIFSGDGAAGGYAPVMTLYDPVSGVFAGISQQGKRGGGSFWRGISSSPSSIVYWDEGRKQVEECKTADPGGTVPSRPSEAPGPAATAVPSHPSEAPGPAATAVPSRPSEAPAPTGPVTTCVTKDVGGGKEFTVVNLLAVPSTE